MMQKMFWRYMCRWTVVLLMAAGFYVAGLLMAPRAQGALPSRAEAAAQIDSIVARNSVDTTRKGRNDAPVVRAKLSADTILIGQRVKLRIEVDKDVMQMIGFPEFENGRLADSLEILMQSRIDTVRQGRREHLSCEYLLTCFSPADYRMGKFPALWADKNIVDTVWSVDSIRLIVMAPPVDTVNNTIYDIRPPMPIPLRFGEVSGYMLIGLVVALIIALVIYLLLFKRGKGLLAALRGPADPPHVTAIKELEKLHTQKLWQCGKSKQYYTGLTEILREYLVGRYHFQAMEMTSAEILACIRELAVEERSAARLKRLLEVADFVKFAKLEPDPEQNEDAYQDAYYFVEETKEQPAEQQGGQNGNGQNGQSGANAMQSTVVPQSPVVSQASGMPQSTSQPLTAQRVVSPQGTGAEQSVQTQKVQNAAGSYESISSLDPDANSIKQRSQTEFMPHVADEYIPTYRGVVENQPSVDMSAEDLKDDNAKKEEQA